jgi:hypothetical protein
MKCDSRAHSWPIALQALALVTSSRLGLRQIMWYFKVQFDWMSDLTNYQIGHFSQIDQLKNTHCHSNLWPLIKNTCNVVKKPI